MLLAELVPCLWHITFVCGESRMHCLAFLGLCLQAGMPAGAIFLCIVC